MIRIDTATSINRRATERIEEMISTAASKDLRIRNIRIDRIKTTKELRTIRAGSNVVG